MGPLASSRQLPTTIFCRPLCPVGTERRAKRTAARCQRLRVVGSGIKHHLTTPSTLRSAGNSPPISIPRRRASEERTWSLSSFSPSISLDRTTSSVSVSGGLHGEDRSRCLPSCRQAPCSARLQPVKSKRAESQVNAGQSACSRGTCQSPPHVRILSVEWAAEQDKVRKSCGLKRSQSPHRLIGQQRRLLV